MLYEHHVDEHYPNRQSEFAIVDQRSAKFVNKLDKQLREAREKAKRKMVVPDVEVQKVEKPKEKRVSLLTQSRL